MQIHLTFDYELFFGANSGTVQNCLLKPTQRLFELSSRYKIPLVFYVDAGYLYQLKKFGHIEQCSNDYTLVSDQLKQLLAAGHEIALHVHPHWEDSVYENNQWKIDTKRYKLASFSVEEVENIVTKYHHSLIEITGEPCHSYRAGGWCVQPFEPIKKALQKNNISKDTSVYFKGVHLSPAHSYDFSAAPNKDRWKFESDPSIEEKEGSFMEIPTTPDVIPPIFYWNLYLKMRSNPEFYRPVGDGSWLVDKKRLYKHFYSSTNHFACADGFFASRLTKILNRAEKEGRKHFSVLSHPKSLAPYSFEALENFIMKAKSKGHTFTTIASV